MRLRDEARIFPRRSRILRDVDRIRHIPALISQGRDDMVCPIRTEALQEVEVEPVAPELAVGDPWDLHRAWPEAELRIIPDAGHSIDEPGYIHELIWATEGLR